MPSKWRVTVGDIDPSEVSLSAIHAVVSGWLDLDHHLPVKPYSVTPLIRSGSTTSYLEVRVMDAQSEERLVKSVTVGRIVRFGRQQTVMPMGALELLESARWADFLTDDQPKRWTLTFLTPTTFRSGDQYSPWPDPITLITSVHRRMRTFDSAMPELPRLRRDDVLVTRVDGRSESVILGKRHVPGFIGEIDYSVGRRSKGIEIIGGVLRFAEYSGAGSHTTHGLGVVSVVGEIPARLRGRSAAQVV